MHVNNNLNISSLDNLKISTHVEDDSFTSKIDYFDTSDEVADFIIQFNDCKISFKDNNDFAFCNVSKREYF